MKIENFQPFIGKHCETTATGSLLKQLGYDISEPMLFGIGQGLGYLFWSSKTMGFPFIGGRIKTDLITSNICKNLNLTLEVKETTAIKKAWNNIQDAISKGKPVGLKLDCYHLEYFTSKFHFAGHYVALYGYDDKYAYLIDTDQQGGRVRTSLKSLELARNEKGPMSSRNKSYTIEKNGKSGSLKSIIKTAILNNANTYLNPPIKNLYYKGIHKTATEIKKWFNNSSNIKRDFQTTAMIMERGGTGGALFRNLYRDFLKESSNYVGHPNIYLCYKKFSEIALLWTEVSSLLNKVGETENAKYLAEASELFVELSKLEKEAMEILKKI